jgi:hypothetical protein
VGVVRAASLEPSAIRGDRHSQVFNPPIQVELSGTAFPTIRMAAVTVQAAFVGEKVSFLGSHIPCSFKNRRISALMHF